MRIFNKFITTKQLVLIASMITMVCCKPTAKEVPAETVDTAPVETEQFNEEAYNQEIAEKRSAALHIALEHIQDAHFYFDNDTFRVEMNNLFRNNRKTVKISTTHYMDLYTDVYQVRHDSLIILLETETTAPFGDTIFDANGDGLKDLLIYHTTLAGCCRREIFDTYLQKPDGTFNEMIDLMNPVFSPKEKVIRGLEYGHDHTLYKFRWKGYSLDTIEYIYTPADTAAHYVIRTDKSNDVTKGDTLPQLPNEYENLIQDLNTFTESFDSN